MQEADSLIAANEIQPPVSFVRFCGVAFVEMVKKRFITSGASKRLALLPAAIKI